MKHAYFVFKDMQHDFCKFSHSVVVRNGIKKDRTLNNRSKEIVRNKYKGKKDTTKHVGFEPLFIHTE